MKDDKGKEFLDPFEIKKKFKNKGYTKVFGDINKCFYCNDSLLETTRTKDHVYPKSLGGTLKVWCCKYCNNLKGNKTPNQWYLFVKNMEIYPTEAKKRRLESIRKAIKILN